MGQATEIVKRAKAAQLAAFIGPATMMAMAEGFTCQWYQQGDEVSLLLSEPQGNRAQKSWRVDHLTTAGSSPLPEVLQLMRNVVTQGGGQ